jgi:hypothetical protein
MIVWIRQNLSLARSGDKQLGRYKAAMERGSSLEISCGIAPRNDPRQAAGAHATSQRNLGETLALAVN